MFKYEKVKTEGESSDEEKIIESLKGDEETEKID